MPLRFQPARGASVFVSSVPRGPSGAPGQDGANGSAATITVGTTTTGGEGTSAAVSNSGSSSAAVFDFTVPRGAIPATGFNFSTTTTDSDPGSGNVRFNNATPASVTAIYFDNTDRDGNTITGWLDTFDDSTNTAKGTLTIIPAASPSGKLIYDVSGSVVDGTGYRKITVSHVTGTTLPSNGVHLGVTFSRTGNKGADGAGTGDVSGPGSATDSNLAAFNTTTGKLIKDSGKAYPTGVIVGNTDTQTLTNKTIAGASNTLTVREADLSLSDNTTNDSSTAKHGLLKKLSNSATEYMDGTGNWSTPAGSGSLTAVVDDTSPELGGSLDANGHNIGFDDNTGITDDSGNEQLWFQKTASAVNFVEVTNSATGNSPSVYGQGSDSNIGLKLGTKGTAAIFMDTAKGVGINTSTTDLGSYGFSPTLTILGTADRAVLELATSQSDDVGDTIGSIVFTNTNNTGTGANKKSFIIQSNSRNYSGGGAGDRSADLTFTAFKPDIDDFQQVFAIGSTDGVGSIIFDTEGPHGINTDQVLDTLLYIGGNQTKATGATFGASEILRISTNANVPVNMDGRGLVLSPTFNEAASGTHAKMSSVLISPPNIVNGSAATTNAITLYITGAPTGGATNYAIWVDAGVSRFDGNIDCNSSASIVNLVDPASDQDAATKNYVDTQDLVQQNSKSTAYTTVLSDKGKHIYHPSSDNNARTFTIDSNANVAYPIGTTITFVNEINTVTIAITSDTLFLAGAGSTGSRSLAANGIATALKVGTTRWIISGTGLT